MKPLKIGITGVRGIVGETFTPELAVEFSQAFGTYLDGGRILVCRDTRPSGPMVQAAVMSGVLAAGCDVIDLGESERVLAATGSVVHLHSGEQAAIPVPLDEAEGGVAERRRDRKHRQRAGVVLEALDVGDERPAPFVQQRERPVDVLDVEHHGAHALRVLAQVAPRPSPFADRLMSHEQRGARAEGRGALPSLLLQLRPAGPDLDEVQLVDEEPPRAVEIVDVVVQRFDALDAD